jgi:hypothetical protein
MTGERFRRDSRGQTLQDFVTGASLFLLTVAFVFAFVPVVFTPFEAPVETEHSVQSDRVASAVVLNITQEGDERLVDTAAREDFFDMSSADLDDRYPLRPGSDLNVTIQRFDASGNVVVESVGDPYGEDAVAATTRVLAGEYCDPTCRVVVRVW